MTMSESEGTPGREVPTGAEEPGQPGVVPGGEEEAAGRSACPAGEPEGEPEVDELEALKAQLAEEHDAHLRAVAELHNYRRRVTQERAQQLQFANEQLLSALLPVLDHFEMALEH
jgi:molecular chaperone GrpE (heat shock protein)